MRTGELRHEKRRRWPTLAARFLARDVREARAATRDTADATDASALASLPANAGWRVLNHGLGNARDMTLAALDNQTAFGAGMRRALAQWQVETAPVLGASRNTTQQAAASAAAESAAKKARR